MSMILEISTSMSSVRTNISNQKFRLNEILNKGFIIQFFLLLILVSLMHIEIVD